MVFYFCIIWQFLSLYVMNVHEALEYLENLDISSEDDLPDDQDFISRGRLVILPPNDEGDRDTNEDSGDKNELLQNSLNRSQLLAGVTVNLLASGNISLGTGDEEEVAVPQSTYLQRRIKDQR